MKYEKLFSPIKVGNSFFPNRIMLTAAVTRLAAEDGHVTQAVKDRYRRIAEGGLGSMVVEAAVTSHSAHPVPSFGVAYGAVTLVHVVE